MSSWTMSEKHNNDTNENPHDVVSSVLYMTP